MKPQTWLWYGGILLVLSGFVHLLVWVFSHTTWEGAVSWRKPALFGLSTGVTLLSIAWLFPKLKPRRFDSSLAAILSLSLVIEVALITVQQWRGVPSHFNRETPFDNWIEHSLTGLIVLATLLLFIITFRSFGRLATTVDVQLAIRGGLIYLLVSCLIGFAILIYGETQIAIGGDPSRWGRAGVVKFPHGIAIHAIQFFPLCCWGAARLRLTVPERFRMVRCLIAAVLAVLIFSIVQTLGGRSRWELTWGSTVWLGMAGWWFLLGLWPLAVAVLGLRGRRIVALRN
jgi:hypothetical protein